jgi:GNAT superfamily N-acetyltransferase
MDEMEKIKQALYYRNSKRSLTEALFEFVYLWELQKVSSIVSNCELTNLQTQKKENGVVLDQLLVYPLLRNKGLGTQYLTDFLILADEYHQNVFLFPSDALGAETNRLIAFYQKFDFLQNRGETRIYKDFNGMYRRKR